MLCGFYSDAIEKRKGILEEPTDSFQSDIRLIQSNFSKWVIRHLARLLHSSWTL
ncbi:MAG: hypothetical protein RJA81_981 [Planctomycetota bacterium]|jgi:hypothetical protein